MELLVLVSWILHDLINVQEDADEALFSHQHQMFLKASQRNEMDGWMEGGEGFLQQLLHNPGKAPVVQPRLAISFGPEDGVAQEENVLRAASTAGKGDGRKDKGERRWASGRLISTDSQ